MSYASEKGVSLIPIDEEIGDEPQGNANDGKIYITISDERHGKSASDKKKDDKKDDDVSWQEYAIIHLGKAVIDQTLHVAEWSIATIGDRTGNYQRQREINVMFDMVHKSLNIGGAMFLGAKALPVAPQVGMAVGALISVGSEIVNKGLDFYQAQLSNKKQNYEIEQLRIRSGLDTSTNGNRGTEN